MKKIETAIKEMNIEDAKILKTIAEFNITFAEKNSRDEEQAERIDEVLEMIIVTTKERIENNISKTMDVNDLII